MLSGDPLAGVEIRPNGFEIFFDTSVVGRK